jgi:hypothetical protein
MVQLVCIQVIASCRVVGVWRHLERSQGPITENLELDVYFIVAYPFDP